ncbi:MAG: hypothetical protein IJT27_09635 [Clostridia bacterium]|nr:hypothetical protein [Clostridia bacterium]
MKRITIADVTLKQLKESRETDVSFKEKIELAKLLDRLQADVIELEGIENQKVDSLRIKSIALAVKNSAVAVPVSLDAESVEIVWAALKEAKRPRLQVPAAMSPVQMEYLSHKKPAAMLEAVCDAVAACRAKTDDVEFIAEDCTRADAGFLADAVQKAIEAGAKTVTLADAAGNLLPEEFAAFLEDIRRRVPAIGTVRLGVSCANTLSMADACAVAAVFGGADEVKAAAYPVNTPSLQSIAKILEVKGEPSGISTGVRTVEIKRVTEQIARICRQTKNGGETYGAPLRAEDGGVTLSAHDGPAAVNAAVKKLGYELDEADLAAVFAEVQKLAARRETIDERELDAIVAAAAMQVPPTYTLKSYVVNSGNVLTAMASVKITKNGEELEGASLGDGPIDAAFHAVEQVSGRRFELDDFQIRAVTEGKEAMGETVIRLLSDGKLYSGRGISTDIIGASIFAYINALNKIVYEEGQA